MIKQTIVWTLLPDPGAARAADGSIPLSLLVSPRLTHDEVVPLSRYPQLANWPDVPLRVDVEITGPDGALTVAAEFTGDPPDAALWRAVFPPGLPVVPFVFDNAPADTPILSYPVEPLRASLAHEYGRLFGPAEVRSLEGDVPSGEVESNWEAVDRLIRVVGDGAQERLTLSNARARLDAAPDDLAEDRAGWRRLADFHRPRQPEGRVRTPGLARRGEPAERDFHAVFATLADHPQLQTRLGLVRGLRVRLPTGLAGPVTIRAVPSNVAGLSHYRPRTRCVAGPGWLRLAIENGGEASPYLPLDDTSRYAAIDVDVDATGLALQSYASSLALARRDGAAPRLRPPAPRSDGIFVAEANRQIGFKAALRRAADVLDADLAAGGDGGAITLNADDVQQGYRVDVLDADSGRWYPLCRRVGAYRVAGITAPLPIDDEGTVSDVLTASDSDGEPANLLHQSLFRWSGWSLVAPPPGLMVGLDDQPTDPVPESDSDLPFTMNVTPAPGTLPSLRYGRGYRFRARLVNVAGRSAPFGQDDPANPAPATPTLRHSRYEPVPSPVLVPRRPVTEGESAAVMVVRTDNSDPANPRPGPTCERHVLAPKASVATLERHGVLDIPGENRLDPNAYALLFERDQRVVAGVPDTGARGTPFIDADTTALPWLPDPLAHGIAVHGLPGSSDLRLDWPRGATWHDRPPIRLIVEPGEDAPPPPRIDTAGRAVRVSLEPGASLTTTLSSRLGEGDEELLGPWRWFADVDDRTAVDVAARRDDAAAGRVGQLTPPYEVRMIHAVRCPHRPAVFGAPRIERLPDDTTYELVDPAIGVHPASTVSVHVQAEWSDIVDDPARPEPSRVKGQAVLEQKDQDRLAAWDHPPTAQTVPFRAGAGLGDTRHHVVRFTPVATSRFASYFTQRRTVRLVGAERVRLGEALVPGTVVVTGQDSPPGGYRLDRDVVVDYPAGTIARRVEGAILDGTDVEVAFVVPPITRDGPAITRSVPASARPAPPTVHSVMPAYAWRRERDGNTIMSSRRGGLLRVFLERPWFDSGDGELLAVIVADDELRGISQATWTRTLPFVSGAGADPTGLGGGAPDLARSTFPRATASRTVRVPDLRDSDPSETANPLFRVRAVGHPVEFDPRRRLWFSDIEIRHETDQPFVQLKLARLQPEAIASAADGVFEDLHISRIVDAGFHQLPTDRTATVIVDGTTARVTVTGPSLLDVPSEVTATVRARGQDADGDPTIWEGLWQMPRTTLTMGPAVEGSTIRRWTGLVQLPTSPGDRPAQVLLREHQLLPGGPHIAGQSRRPTYVDVVDL